MHDYETDLRLLIDGEWVETAHRKTMLIINPATGTALGMLPLADEADLDRALDAAARAFKTWRHSAVDDRARILRGAAALLRERAPAIARHATLEQGKPLAESTGEVMASANLLEFYAEECRRAYGRVLVRPHGRRSLVTKEPVGPVASFAPWNFPLHNPARKLAPAIAAGCSVIMKAAEEAPASALHVARALVDAGLPRGVVQMVFGRPEMVSRHLLASPVLRKLSFTGSTAVGKELMRLAVDQALRTTMELGGHAPAIVFDDADIEAVATQLARTKYRNAGQICISPTRFYVQRAAYGRFVDRFVQQAATITVGNGLDPGVQMGPLAHARRPSFISGLVDDAWSQGAEILLGGRRVDSEGFHFPPSVLGNVPESARAMNEEPFGPIALLAPFDDYDEVVSRANRLPYGLAAYAFTRDARTARRIAADLESGMVGINTTSIAAADAPFVGVKHSGHGAEDGPEGLESYLVTKALHEE